MTFVFNKEGVTNAPNGFYFAIKDDLTNRIENKIYQFSREINPFLLQGKRVSSCYIENGLLVQARIRKAL